MTWYIVEASVHKNQQVQKGIYFARITMSLRKNVCIIYYKYAQKIYIYYTHCHERIFTLLPIYRPSLISVLTPQTSGKDLSIKRDN